MRSKWSVDSRLLHRKKIISGKGWLEA